MHNASKGDTILGNQIEAVSSLSVRPLDINVIASCRSHYFRKSSHTDHNNHFVKMERAFVL